MTNYQNVRVCLVTNRYLDEEYIEEWCEHYYKLGFTLIYILEDINGRDKFFINMPYIKSKVDQHKMIIEQIPHQNQWFTYPMFYEQHKNEFEWCAIFDSDEFLVLHKHNTIQDFLNDPTLKFNDADSIQICWRYYDDNDQLCKTYGSVMDRFPRLAKYNKESIETKIIIKGNLYNVTFFIGHAASANNQHQRVKFCDGSIIGKLDPFHAVNYEYAQLNHYYSKSTEEFLKRKSIGRLDIPTKSYYNSLLDFMEAYFNINEKTPEKEKMFQNALEQLKNK